MLRTTRVFFLALGIVVMFTLNPSAKADNFSFTGNLATGDQAQLFTFTVGALSTVTLETLSYAGGTNAAGTVIARGGFDPILALFDSTGAFINQNDDGGSSVPADITGVHYDTFLQSSLAAGTYTVAVMQYDNFANGPNLSDGFANTGNPNFATAFNGGTCGTNQFVDVAGAGQNSCRDSHWAFDILGVNSASQEGGGGGTPVPEPNEALLLGIGLVSFAIISKALRA